MVLLDIYHEKRISLSKHAQKQAFTRICRASTSRGQHDGPDILASLRAKPRLYAVAMLKILVRWALLAAALLLVAHLYPGVSVSSFSSALLAAFVLGLLNALLRPVLVVLTLPVTLITLGLFLFVINAVIFYFAANLLQGLSVSGFGAALIGSVLYSLCGMVIDVAVERLFGRG